MGRVTTPTYRVEYRTNALALGKVAADTSIEGKGYHVQAWRGRATPKAAEEWRKAMNASFQKGGANYHLTEALGFIEHVSHVRVVHQATGRLVAEATMPTFEVM